MSVSTFVPDRPPPAGAGRGAVSVPSYGGIVAWAGMLRVFAWLWLTAGIIAILSGGLGIVGGELHALVGVPLLAAGVLMVPSGLFRLMFAQVVLAIRDIARNSFVSVSR